MKKTIFTLLTTAALTFSVSEALAKKYELLNVSYDPTRELYDDYNKEFAEYYKKKTGDIVKIRQLAGLLHVVHDDADDGAVGRIEHGHGHDMD